MLETVINEVREGLSDLAWDALKLIGWIVAIAINIAVIIAFVVIS